MISFGEGIFYVFDPYAGRLEHQKQANLETILCLLRDRVGYFIEGRTRCQGTLCVENPGHFELKVPEIIHSKKPKTSRFLSPLWDFFGFSRCCQERFDETRLKSAAAAL